MISKIMSVQSIFSNSFKFIVYGLILFCLSMLMGNVPNAFSGGSDENKTIDKKDEHVYFKLISPRTEWVILPKKISKIFIVIISSSQINTSFSKHNTMFCTKPIGVFKYKNIAYEWFGIKITREGTNKSWMSNFFGSFNSVYSLVSTNNTIEENTRIFKELLNKLNNDPSIDKFLLPEKKKDKRKDA